MVNLSEDDFPSEAIAEFKQVKSKSPDAAAHFMKGFRLAVDGVSDPHGGFSRFRYKSDRWRAIQLVTRLAANHTNLTKNSYRRYARIARRSLFFNVPWDIAKSASPESLSACVEQLKSARLEQTEENMTAAWKRLDRAHRGLNRHFADSHHVDRSIGINTLRTMTRGQRDDMLVALAEGERPHGDEVPEFVRALARAWLDYASGMRLETVAEVRMVRRALVHFGESTELSPENDRMLRQLVESAIDAQERLMRRTSYQGD